MCNKTFGVRSAHMVPQVDIPTHIKKKQFRQFKHALYELYIHQSVHVYIFFAASLFLADH